MLPYTTTLTWRALPYWQNPSTCSCFHLNGKVHETRNPFFFLSFFGDRFFFFKTATLLRVKYLSAVRQYTVSHFPGALLVCKLTGTTVRRGRDLGVEWRRGPCEPPFSLLNNATKELRESSSGVKYFLWQEKFSSDIDRRIIGCKH